MWRGFWAHFLLKMLRWLLSTFLWSFFLKGYYCEIFYLHFFFFIKLILLGPWFMGLSHCAKKFLFVNTFNLKVFFAVVRYMQQHFLRCGIQQRRFSFVVVYNERSFFLLWDTMKTISGWLKFFFLRCIPQCRSYSSVMGYNRSVFFRCIPQCRSFLSLCSTPQQNLKQYTGSHNTEAFPCCMPHRTITFSS